MIPDEDVGHTLRVRATGLLEPRQNNGTSSSGGGDSGGVNYVATIIVGFPQLLCLPNQTNSGRSQLS